MPFPSTISLTSVRALLADLGVEVRHRQHEWHECLLLSAEGTWTGCGDSEETALWQAVGGAFPAGPARTLLLRMAATAGAIAEEIPAAPPSEAAAAPTPAGPAAPSTPDEAPAPPTIAESVIGPVPAIMATEPAPTTLEDTPAEPAHAVSGPVVAEDTHGDENQNTDSIDVDEDPETALRDLVARIERDCAELALAAPPRQRLVLLGWLATARTWQDTAANDSRVAAMVPEIVRRLRACTDAWWPGTISAFQREAWPENCLRDLPDHASATPRTWRAVARCTAEALERLEDRESAAGFDPDGWADAACLHPAPEAPDEMLATLVREIEQHGSLTQRQPKHLPPPDPELLLRWTRQARWLRGATDEGSSWGAVMGRLRFWCQGPAAGEARRMLDPAYRPTVSWGALVRSIDEAAREEGALRELLAKAPAADMGKAQRFSWLRRALPLTTNHHDEIVAAAAPISEWILELSADDLGIADKRLRRRLRKMQESFHPEVARDDEDECDDEADNDEPLRASTVPDAVRSETRGKQVLFVSNRADPQLQERLVDDFNFGALDWAEATPRRIDAAVEKITSGSFEMVLGANGFLSHKEDYRLANACKTVGIPYVRVNKGRPGAVTLALQRELPGAVA